MSDERILCRVDPGLVDHVRQLLTDAGLAVRTVEAPDRRILVIIPAAQEEHARSVIGLVLPDLLGDAGETPLSQRLVRSEDPGLPGGLVDATRTLGYADPLADRPLDDDAEFVPPSPPPLPRPRDRFAAAAWIAVIAGPVLLILVQVVTLPSYLSTLGLLMFFGGFGTLLYRMEDRVGSGDGPDDGAVV